MTVKYIDVTNMTEAELIELLENASKNRTVEIVIKVEDNEDGGDKE